MTLLDDINDAVRTHDIFDVLGSRKKIQICPLPQHIHHSNTPSFSVFWKNGVQRWKCHGNCNLEGDIVDLVGFLRIPGYQRYNAKSRRQALTLLDERYDVKIVLPEKENTLGGGEWIEYLPPGKEVIGYAKNRGLSRETIDKFRVGQGMLYGKTCMTMPCFEDGRLKGIKLRNVYANGKDTRYFNIEGSRQGLFNFDKVYLKQEVVFVVKGEIPCMLLDQLGYLACAPTGGEGGWSERWRTCLAFASKVVIGDNDDAGRKLGERRATLLDAQLVFPPEKFKDWDQWYLAEPEEALEVLAEWKEKYGQHI